MPVYQIRYATENTYEGVVSEGLFDLLVTPCVGQGQQLIAAQQASTLDGAGRPYVSAWGFQVWRFRAAHAFTACGFDFTFTVQRETSPLPSASLTGPDAWAALRALDLRVAQGPFLAQTPYTRLGPTSPALSPADLVHPYAYLQALMAFIHAHIRFQPDVTTVHTTAQETLALGQGVCQDMVHVFVGLARQAGIPCRYVSGYLNPGAHYAGDTAMHAWAEAYLPGSGWTGWDPTNNLLVDRHFIKVAHGVDYTDCSPLRGVLRTQGGHETRYRVQVQEQGAQ